MQQRHPDQDRLTGEFEPVKGIDRETPEFDPRGYLKVPGEKAKLARVLRQCPSVWDLGVRVKTIIEKKEQRDARPEAAAC